MVKLPIIIRLSHKHTSVCGINNCCTDRLMGLPVSTTKF